MPKFMYTVQVTEDYIFEAVDREQAENVAGLIRAVDDPELAQEIIESKNGFVQVDFSETIMEEE
jgi:hypothetical protein